MADTSWMARVGARLVTNGYAILPIAPGTKKPGQFARATRHDQVRRPRPREMRSLPLSLRIVFG